MSTTTSTTSGWSRRYLDYFLGFSVSRAKLVAFRVCFFTLVGLDGILQLPHAPRYGAGDFNVGHFAWLQEVLPQPERAVMVVIFLLQAYLGLRIAMGAAARSAVWLLTALYGYAYFVSQLDSYQHHYLVFLLLLLCCFVPWHRQSDNSSGQKFGHGSTPKMTAPKKPADDGRIYSWAVRLVIMQMGIVYLFAAVTKCESLWLDGTVLAEQLQSGVTLDMAEWLGMGSAAWAVLLAEGFLAVALIAGRLWLPAVAVGVGLHAGIEFGAEFKIGIFSYYMFALYLLLVPDSWFDSWFRRLQRNKTVNRAVSRLQALRPTIARAGTSTSLLSLVALVALGGGWLLLDTIPVAEIRVFAAIVSALAVCTALAALNPRAQLSSGHRRVQVIAIMTAHLLACAAIPLLPETRERVGDYYKYWGGSARRLGNWDEAGAAYARLAELRPDWAPAHYYLGRIAHKDQRVDQALTHYERAQKANGDDYRSFLQAALIHHQAQRGQEALTAARGAANALASMRATSSVQRARQQVRQLINHWSGRVQPR